LCDGAILTIRASGRWQRALLNESGQAVSRSGAEVDWGKGERGKGNQTDLMSGGFPASMPTSIIHGTLQVEKRGYRWMGESGQAKERKRREKENKRWMQ